MYLIITGMFQLEILKKIFKFKVLWIFLSGGVEIANIKKLSTAFNFDYISVKKDIDKKIDLF